MYQLLQLSVPKLSQIYMHKFKGKNTHVQTSSVLDRVFMAIFYIARAQDPPDNIHITCVSNDVILDLIHCRNYTRGNTCTQQILGGWEGIEM